MKIHNKQHHQFELNGSTEISISFEIGDIFVQKDETYWVISIFSSKGTIIRNPQNEKRTINLYSKEFFEEYRYAGENSGKVVTSWKDALDLS